MLEFYCSLIMKAEQTLSQEAESGCHCVTVERIILIRLDRCACRTFVKLRQSVRFYKATEVA